MAASGDDLELPGFVRDPVTGRYYRKPPTGTPQGLNIKSNIRHSIENRSCLKETCNVTKVISQRSLGQLVNTKFETDILESKTKDLILKKTFHLSNDGAISRLSQVDCQLLKRGNGTIIGKWAHKDAPSMTYFGEFEEDFTNEGNNFHAFLFKRSISDLCECYDPQHRYVAFSAHTTDNVGSIYLIEILPCDDPRGYGSISRFDLNIVSPIWCCSSNQQKLNFAVGLEKFVNIYSVTGLVRSLGVPGQAHTVEFDKTGNLVLSGLNNGKLIMSDLRTERECDVSVKLSNDCLRNIKLSSGENYIIYGDSAGKIKRVDFRMDLNCVAEYEGHSGSKPYFSFTETFNLLCSNGQDNVTRLWSLEHGGKPLRTIETPEGCSSNSIISDLGARCTVYHIVNEMVNVYEL